MEAEEFKRVVNERLETLQTEGQALREKLEHIDRLLRSLHIVLQAEESNSTSQPASVRTERGTGAKTIELVKEILMAAGQVGILPREVRGELEKLGVNPGPQVTTNALSRWKKRDYTVEIGGRHYWKSYLSDIELQKVRPRKRRDLTRRGWEPPTVSPINGTG